MPLIQRLQSKLNPNLVRLLAYLKPHKGKLLMSVFFMIGAGAGSSLIALLLGKLTDVGFYDQEEWIVLGAPAALIFIAFLHGGSMFMSNYLLGKTTQSVLVQLRGEIFRKLLRWPAATYQGYPTGAVTSKFIYESNVALSSAAKSSIILVRDTCQVVALVCVLLWKNWLLALVILPPARAPDRQASAIHLVPRQGADEALSGVLRRSAGPHQTGVRRPQARQALRHLRIRTRALPQHQRHDAQDAARNDEGLLARNAAHAGDLHVGRRRRAGLRHVPDEPRAPDDG